jgi:hypothetical protein
MDQQFTVCTGPSLEEVQQRFERWREGRKRGTPIPAALWEDAVCLCADHSLCKISSALHLDYNALKKRFHSACPDHFPESVTPSDFLALDLRSSLPEFIMEMERAGGRGGSGLDRARVYPAGSADCRRQPDQSGNVVECHKGCVAVPDAKTRFVIFRLFYNKSFSGGDVCVTECIPVSEK